MCKNFASENERKIHRRSMNKNEKDTFLYKLRVKKLTIHLQKFQKLKNKRKIYSNSRSKKMKQTCIKILRPKMNEEFAEIQGAKALAKNSRKFYE